MNNTQVLLNKTINGLNYLPGGTNTNREQFDKLMENNTTWEHVLAPMKFNKNDFLNMAYNELLGSFPDWHLNISNITVHPENWVSIEIQPSGTHTGKPFTFAGLPPVAASGKKITLPPEQVWIHWNNNIDHILQMIVTPRDYHHFQINQLSGPLEFYRLTGGNIPQQMIQQNETLVKEWKLHPFARLPDLLKIEQVYKTFENKDRELLKTLLHPQFQWKIQYLNQSYNVNETLQMMFDVVIPSFPDFTFGMNFLNNQQYQVRNGVVDCFSLAQGTHTGSPFAFPPGQVQAIPAAGKHWVANEDVCSFTMKDGLIFSVDTNDRHIPNEVDANKQIGFFEIYRQLGGTYSPALLAQINKSLHDLSTHKVPIGGQTQFSTQQTTTTSQRK